MTDDAKVDLIKRVACGDTAAFDELYRLTVARVIAVIRHKLVDHAQSEEVAQEVFLEIWQNAARFDSERGQPLSWILSIATHRAIDRVRASEAARQRDRMVAARSVDTPHDEVWEHVQTAFETDRMQSLMTSITSLQAEAVTITYLRGYTIAEASRRVGSSESAMKARVRAGLIGLRAALRVDGLSAHGLHVQHNSGNHSWASESAA